MPHRFAIDLQKLMPFRAYLLRITRKVAENESPPESQSCVRGVTGSRLAGWQSKSRAEDDRSCDVFCFCFFFIFVSVFLTKSRLVTAHLQLMDQWCHLVAAAQRADLFLPSTSSTMATSIEGSPAWGFIQYL
uniref:Uncharacterized protein n=1 Tax=Physcomitrium patens TaxID=3218 RepID=A0A7I4BS63_PHYPA